MHSIKSLRAIRSLELIVGNCHLDVGERYDRRPPIKFPEPYQEPCEEGEIIAVMTYDLVTRKITINRPESK